MYKIFQIKMPLGFTPEELQEKIIKKTNILKIDICNIKILKKSIDARNKSNIFFIINAGVELKSDAEIKLKSGVDWKIEKVSGDIPSNTKQLNPNIKIINTPIIIGAGPAGLFAALSLAENGLKPIIVERGNEVGKRVADIEEFKRTGILNTESNIQFGEGGAGTFSDGKLTTGIKDIRINKILEIFCEAGAPEEILYESKPHIGTDVLRNVIVNLRKRIVSLGGKFLFGTKFIDFETENNKIKNIIVIDRAGIKSKINTDTLIIAIGHSARDTFEMLYSKNVEIISKPFSVGVRIEHKQLFINKSQYGKHFNHPSLGAADYKLSMHLQNRRGVYTFCMCPGGYIVPASSEKNMLCINGMSEFKRDAVNSNSAILVGIAPKDITPEDVNDERMRVFAGIEFQRKLESKAFDMGGGNYKAPVQLAEDFTKGIQTKQIKDVEPSYPMGYEMVDLSNIFPKFINEALKEGLIEFDKRIDGFIGNGAVLIGAETRSSSPVRIIRGDNMQSNIEGIYPCGEGAGYSGGITSSAVDGMKAAERVMGNYM